MGQRMAGRAHPAADDDRAAAATADGPGDAVELELDAPAAVMNGELEYRHAKAYLLLAVDVPPGTARVEVGYRYGSYGPEDQYRQTVVDLGLWGPGEDGSPDAFRGWSGSRQGRRHRGQPPVFIQEDRAERGYLPGPIEPGRWHVELGIGAAHPDGGYWQVEARCLSSAVDPGPPARPDRVDTGHVARTGPGWFRADLHLHGYHSHPDVPDWEHVMAHARRAGLDIVPVTEYVTTVHWDELGPVQRRHPDLLVWPGREVITYHGHVVTLGETPSSVEYRHGHRHARIGGVQRDARSDGALFQIAHPTSFPGEGFAHHCRGCEFTLGSDIDWDAVDTLEVITGPAVVDAATFQAPTPGLDQDLIANPFVGTAVELWDSLLRAGHRITAVSGSDDKLGPGYGMTATRIYAPELSRAAVADALRAGYAYVEARGQGSPELTMTAHTDEGHEAVFGGSLAVAPDGTAEFSVTVLGAAGQDLVVVRNGMEHHRVSLATDDEVHRWAGDRAAPRYEGPLGSFWRVEVHDSIGLTALGNPIFLSDGR